MFKKRRRPTPGFKIPPPYNPIQGEYADLYEEGLSPYCALVQVAAVDEYTDYVICRGFDTRIKRFVDYEEGNPNKPGLMVAKPYSSRDTGRYRVGEVYTAFLPIQGTEIATPPIPNTVDFRIGQNPGTASASTRGGHPDALTDSIDLLNDHNGLAINWMLVHPRDMEIQRFQSTITLSGTSTTACVRRMDGEDAHLTTIYDPDEIFDGMEAKTKGLVMFQGSKFYIIQAKCTPETSLDTCE